MMRCTLENTRKDCFAYDSELDYCTATVNETCKGCNFYKHSDSPAKTRVSIEMEIAFRESRSSKIVAPEFY